MAYQAIQHLLHTEVSQRSTEIHRCHRRPTEVFFEKFVTGSTHQLYLLNKVVVVRAKQLRCTLTGKSVYHLIIVNVVPLASFITNEAVV